MYKVFYDNKMLWTFSKTRKFYEKNKKIKKEGK